jgi:hypothetical protein
MKSVVAKVKDQAVMDGRGNGKTLNKSAPASLFLEF